jgi:hypothetical protein
MGAAQQIAEQRAGSRRDGETIEEWRARVEAAMPRANRRPAPLTTDAVTAERDRQTREGIRQ